MICVEEYTEIHWISCLFHSSYANAHLRHPVFRENGERDKISISMNVIYAFRVFYHVRRKWNLRFNERCPQCARHACGMCIIQFKYAFNDRNFGWCWAHANKCAPIVHNTASSKHLTATIHCTSLDKQPTDTVFKLIQAIWVKLLHSKSNGLDRSTMNPMTLTTSGICNSDDNSSWSWTEVFGCTIPPWLLSTVYDPTNTLLATVWRNTSTFRTSPMISSVSYLYVDYPKWMKWNCN